MQEKRGLETNNNFFQNKLIHGSENKKTNFQKKKKKGTDELAKVFFFI